MCIHTYSFTYTYTRNSVAGEDDVDENEIARFSFFSPEKRREDEQRRQEEEREMNDQLGDMSGGRGGRGDDRRGGGKQRRGDLPPLYERSGSSGKSRRRGDGRGKRGYQSGTNSYMPSEMNSVVGTPSSGMSPNRSGSQSRRPSFPNAYGGGRGYNPGDSPAHNQRGGSRRGSVNPRMGMGSMVMSSGSLMSPRSGGMQSPLSMTSPRIHSRSMK